MLNCHIPFLEGGLSMPKGIIIDCLCIIIGGVIGSKFKENIPHKIKEPLTIIFGICAITIGIMSFIKLHSLPAIIFSLITGTVIGELCDLDTRVKKIFSSIIKKLNFKTDEDEEKYMNFYMIVAITFCASGTNIFGALNEGMTGDMTILLSKASMDIFASVIFASTLGYAINLIVIPQFIIMTLLFYFARIIMPVITPYMMLDFIAVGGLLTFILGLNIAKIKDIKAINLLPALFLVFPISYFFEKLV